MKSRAVFVGLITVATLAGCPPATGRRRGPVLRPDSATTTTCPSEGLPSAGTQCALEGEFCLATRNCPDGTQGTDQCTCTSGIWRCTQGACTPWFDASTCPQNAVNHGQSCLPSQFGLGCPGTEYWCDGKNIPTMCYCDGMRWSCGTPSCDASGVDATRDAFGDSWQDEQTPLDASPLHDSGVDVGNE